MVPAKRTISSERDKDYFFEGPTLFGYFQKFYIGPWIIEPQNLYSLQVWKSSSSNLTWAGHEFGLSRALEPWNPKLTACVSRNSSSCRATSLSLDGLRLKDSKPELYLESTFYF